MGTYDWILMNAEKKQNKLEKQKKEQEEVDRQRKKEAQIELAVLDNSTKKPTQAPTKMEIANPVNSIAAL